MDYILLLNVTVVAVAVVMNLDAWKEFPDPRKGPDVNLLLLGKTGNGRSSLGNNLLGRHEFESHVSPTPITRQSRLERTKIGSRKMSVVDTPGLYIYPSIGETENTVKDLISTFSLCPNGYNAFLIVLNPVNRISQEEIDTIRFLQIIFGDQFFKYAIFIFTHRDIFEASVDISQNVTDEFMSYIDNQPAEMKDYIEKAEQRVMFVNSLEWNIYRNRIFHVDLIRMVDRIWISHRERRYTKGYFDLAQEKLKREITRRMEEEERAKRVHEEKIRTEALASCPCQKKTKQDYDDDMKIVINLNFPGSGYIMKAANFLLGGLQSFLGWAKNTPLLN